MTIGPDELTRDEVIAHLRTQDAADGKTAQWLIDTLAITDEELAPDVLQASAFQAAGIPAKTGRRDA